MRNIRCIFVAIVLALVACDKAFENGDLDGQWRLERVEINGEEFFPANVYYSFQRHLVMLGVYDEQAAPVLYMAEFDYSGGVITMTKFYAHPGIEGVCNKEDLEAYYIYNDESEVFRVERLDDEALVMHTNDGRSYFFRKW